MPVDQYIGGVEHAILHLLYARFFCKALTDLGHLDVQEPFARLFTQGMITRDGAKMSKNKGNVVSPKTIVSQYGADTARCYILFIGPPDRDADWSDSGVEGMYRFLSRLWRTCAEAADELEAAEPPRPGEGNADDERVLRKRTGRSTRSRPTSAAGSFAFNTAIAAVMELLNELAREARRRLVRRGALRAVDGGPSLIFPFAPHVGRRRLREADRPAGVGRSAGRARRRRS
jgi:leucyl-tRNA synthetase